MPNFLISSAKGCSHSVPFSFLKMLLSPGMAAILTALTPSAHITMLWGTKVVKTSAASHNWQRSESCLKK